MINLMKIRTMRFLSLLQKGSVFLLSLVILQVSCKPNAVRVIKSPPHYNFSEAFIHKLDNKLKEISGIAWDRVHDEFIALNDEQGKLYFLDKETKVIKNEYEFGNKGDYEEVALLNTTPYMLRSDGTLYRFLKDSIGRSYGAELGSLPISGNNEFESMYFDPERKALILICKTCKIDNKKSVSAFAYYIDSIGFNTSPVYSIPLTDVEKLSPSKMKRFRPSAASIHTISHQLYILSSASSQLAIADLNGKILGVYELGKKLFPQPEGITFKSNGDMYISNEGGSGKGTILRFVYRP